MSEDRKNSAKPQDMDGGTTILMILFSFIIAAVIVYFNFMFNAIEDFGAPPFIIAFCIGVGAVICLAAVYAIGRGGKGDDDIEQGQS